MAWYADLHVHSRYSRATSKQSDVFHHALWARRKGLRLLGTADFTHPGWREALRRDLEPAEPGLFRLRAEVQAAVDAELAPTLAGETRFVLQVEISTIYKSSGYKKGGYKKDARTRKIHHLVFMPDFEAVDAFVARLERIGNLHSDGRPILGLDSRDLLEMALEASDEALLVPAHVWTPWFAVLGSKSGFDRIEDCYGDLTAHIPAIETGLSSDPAMNRRVSMLDRFRLISCSDAHSPGKLARNATIFEGPLERFSLRRALARGEGYGGTVEFFPQEGKYHLDGHRKCGIRLEPRRTRALGGRCPVCEKPLTVGVLHRVEELADRPADSTYRPPNAGRVLSLVPLPSILSEILGVGPRTRTVERVYRELLRELGPELEILVHLPLERLLPHASPLVVEAIRRLRQGRVHCEAGYDGEFGRIRLFTEAELQEAQQGELLFTLPRRVAPEPLAEDPTGETAGEVPLAAEPVAEDSPGPSPGILASLDPPQREAAGIRSGPLLVVAGPGSGKTRTLTHRVAHLVADGEVPPEGCLTITFTRRAAAELRERLCRLLPERGPEVPVYTFHGLGHALLREFGEPVGLAPDFRVADEEERLALAREVLSLDERSARRLLNRLSRARREGTVEALQAEHPGVGVYGRALAERGLLDFDQLVTLAARLLETSEEIRRTLWSRHPHVSVDEYQDIDAAQHRLVRLLVPPVGPNLCAIGDPDQSIYGFRGADPAFFERFAQDFPGARVLRLDRNYRSGRPIVQSAVRVITQGEPQLRPVEVLREHPHRVVYHEAPTERAEAEFVVHRIEQLLGGHSFFSLDSGRADGCREDELAFPDFAVLYRTGAQVEPLVEAFARSGMPYQRRTHHPLAELPAVRSLVRVLSGAPASGPVAARLAEVAAPLAAEHPDLDPSIEQACALLAPVAERCGDDLHRFLSELALGLEVDAWDPRAERISLLTLHAAKGLEFPVVFVVGLEDGLLPLRFGDAARSDEARAEERRLLYVGMTRARERLFLCRAKKRARHGTVQERDPSPFLAHIRDQILHHGGTAPPRRPTEPEHEQLGLFSS